MDEQSFTPVNDQTCLLSISLFPPVEHRDAVEVGDVRPATTVQRTT